MPMAHPIPPDDPAPPASLLARAGSLLGTSTLAALVGSIPATTRVAPFANNALGAWIALGASALAPMVVGVAIARAAREGARTAAGPDSHLVGWAVATWAMTTFLALSTFGALLRATTHHHGLAGVTFAIGGVAIGGALALVVRRLLHIARSAPLLGRSALASSLTAVLVCTIFVVIVRVGQSGVAERAPGTIVDGLAFAIAAAALSRQTFARVPWLAVTGLPLALGLLALGWALVSREPALLEAIRTHAPLFAPMAALARTG
jgi:hypothetical protein